MIQEGHLCLVLWAWQRDFLHTQCWQTEGTTQNKSGSSGSQFICMSQGYLQDSLPNNDYLPSKFPLVRANSLRNNKKRRVPWGTLHVY